MSPDMKMNGGDHIASKLEQYVEHILVVVFGLLPLFFIPTALAPFEYTKIFFVIVGIASAIILSVFSMLRAGKIGGKFSYVLLSLWVVVLISFVSALLSGDLRDALIGDQIGTHTAVFVAILALTASVWSVLNINKGAMMRLYVLLAASTLVLVVFHLARLLFGAGALSFGVFTSLIATPIGSWNDLALFLGLSVLLSLVALEQLPLTKPGRVLFGVVTVVALCMLAIINFFTVWIVLGLVSLVMLVYTLGKDRFGGSQLSFIPQKNTGASSFTLSLIVFVVSTLFIIGGSSLGGLISKYTNISYIEVRPSLQATIDIARQVYQDHALLGVGTNKFVDAWRMFKDTSINTTVFWNTDFNAGNGYITSFFITTGVLGGIAWMVFLIMFLVSGVRTFLTVGETDRMWYFVGISAFVSAVYIWSMSLVYVPGVVILIMGALCTGITLAAQSAMAGKQPSTFSFINNRRAGFVATLLVIAIVVGSVDALYSIGRHYSASYKFNESIRAAQNGASFDEVNALIEDAYVLSPNDMYVRWIAERELIRMGELLQTTSPTAEQQQQFETALLKGVQAAKLSTDQAQSGDASESANWTVLGSIYNRLVSATDMSAYTFAHEALTKARDLNPRNPLPYLALANLEANAGNATTSRAYVQEAIALKPNFPDAFFFLSQLDIATGNIEGAIASTQAIITLEPQNPARYYQLGVLESARQNVDAAVNAFERAVNLDPNYANARYFLALGYDAQKKTDKAKEQLEKVLELNPGNADIQFLLGVLEKNGSLQVNVASSSPLQSDVQTTTGGENGAVTTETDPNSDLVKPVNTIPAEPESTPASEPNPTGAGSNTNTEEAVQ